MTPPAIRLRYVLAGFLAAPLFLEALRWALAFALMMEE